MSAVADAAGFLLDEAGARAGTPTLRHPSGDEAARRLEGTTASFIAVGGRSVVAIETSRDEAWGAGSTCARLAGSSMVMMPPWR